MILTYTAAAKDEGRKVYSVLRRELRLSETAIKRLKQTDGIRVNGERAFTDRRLLPGDTVEADQALAERAPEFPAEEGPLTVLFESAGLLAADKPAGMLVHPSRGRLEGTLIGRVSGYLLKNEGSAACHAVNRLDRDTSGVVLFAKNAYMKNLAIAALSEPAAEKEYRAILFGALPEDRGVIDAPIRRAEEGKMLRIVADDGQRAVTRYETLRCWEREGMPLSEVRFILETGRTHQIRVHCSYLGAPLLGDRLYGTEDSVAFAERLQLTRHLLHARSLIFCEPVTGERVSVESPVPWEDGKIEAEKS